MEQQQRERQHFDQLADETGEIWWGSNTFAGLRRLQRRAELVRLHLARFEAPSVLELGCGTGSFTRFLLDVLPTAHLTACDISPSTIRRIQERYGTRPNTSFSVEDACHLSQADNSLEAVVGNSVLHHFPLEAALRETLRVLKSGGAIWFSEPNMLNPQIALEKNVRWIGKRLQNSEDETAFFRWPLAAKLRRLGFTRVSVEPYDFLHPGTPESLTPSLEALGLVMEKIPLLREFSGSLVIQARKP